MKNKITVVDIVNHEDLPEVLNIISTYDIEIILVSDVKTVVWHEGWLWWRKKHTHEWVSVTLFHDPNTDVYEPLREAVRRGLWIV